MAKAAAAALNLDLTASWVVGDRPEDVGLAEAIGASAVYLGSDSTTAPGSGRFPAWPPPPPSSWSVSLYDIRVTTSRDLRAVCAGR